MPQYLLSGSKPDGQRVTECVIAPSADAALADFRSRGYYDETLHTDDVGALFTNQQAMAADVSPAEYLRYRDQGGYWNTVWRNLKRTYLLHWFFCVCALTWLISRPLLGAAWGTLDVIAAAALVLPLLAVPISTAFRPSVRYDRLIDAACWGRWEEVLRLLPGLRGRIPPMELAIREGQAWAGLGNLEKGLAIVAPFRDGVQVPEWLYHSRLVELYSAAVRWNLMIPAMEQAERLAPDNATVLLDLAVLVILIERDLPRAKALLAKAKSHAISDLLVPFAEEADGLVALEEDRPAEAHRLFSSAIRAVAPRVPSQPVFGTQVAILHAYLTIACAALGDESAARQHFAQAEPRLVARKLEPLLKRVEEALRKIGRVPTATRVLATAR
jgi:tetratricopeptide (TPR) repeat protein